MDLVNFVFSKNKIKHKADTNMSFGLDLDCFEMLLIIRSKPESFEMINKRRSI